MSTTKETVERFLREHQQDLVLRSPRASKANIARIRTDIHRHRPLPARSMALYVEHGAASDTPGREAANREMEEQGFPSYRQLLPIMRARFPDLWS